MVGIPTVEKLAAFVANASDEPIKAIVARVLESMEFGLDRRAEIFPADVAIHFLHRGWKAREEWWDATFPDDEAFKWLNSEEAISRCWDTATKTTKLRHLHQPRSEDLPQQAVTWVHERQRSWARRVIAHGRTSKFDHPLRRYIIEEDAAGVSTRWKWLRGIAVALHDYLYTDKAITLINERKNIRAMHAEAVKGLLALDAFAKTHFSEQFLGTSDGFWNPRGLERKDDERRIAFQMLGEIRIEDFYPSVRQDATTGERLLVASLADLHCQLFKVPKPDAIAELMGAPFIKSQLDLRTIERICSVRRASWRSLESALYEASNSYRDYHRSNSRRLVG